MYVQLKPGDVVYTLKRHKDDNSKVLTIVRGMVIGENATGSPIFQWDQDAFKDDDYIPLNRVYKTIRALFRHDPVARSFATPDYIEE